MSSHLEHNMKSIKRWSKAVWKVVGIYAWAWVIGFALMSGALVAASYHDVTVAIAYEE